MSPGYNFAAGPARLPDAVLERAQQELWVRGSDGASAAERPFTGAAFRATLAHARQRLAELLAVPEHYRILFLAGGAMHQFSMVPLNLLGDARHAAYADSGYWAQRAMTEARRFTEVTVAARFVGKVPLAAPPLPDWNLPVGSAYCHITPNETAEGIAYPALPDCGDIPLVADATSCLLTAPLDVARFGLLYAAAQKNLGIAGMTVVIVREDLLQRPAARVPTPFSYRLQAQAESCVNTPPTLAIHLAALVFDWIADHGGLAAMERLNQHKATTLYAAIDASEGFYQAPVELAHRSRSNVCFRLGNATLTDALLAQADARGLHNLRGHPQVGGLRASLYNAMPQAGVQALVDCLLDFARQHG